MKKRNEELEKNQEELEKKMQKENLYKKIEFCEFYKQKNFLEKKYKTKFNLINNLLSNEFKDEMILKVLKKSNIWYLSDPLEKELYENAITDIQDYIKNYN